MNIPVKEILVAAKKQTNILIKLELYWLLKLGDKQPAIKGDLVDLTIKNKQDIKVYVNKELCPKSVKGGSVWFFLNFILEVSN